MLYLTNSFHISLCFLILHAKKCHIQSSQYWAGFSQAWGPLPHKPKDFVAVSVRFLTQ